MINEEGKAQRLMNILDLPNLRQETKNKSQSIGGYNHINDNNSKESYRSGTNSHSQAYQALLLAVKYFNIAVSQLRKFKLDSVMNQNYDQTESSDLKMRERCQKYFYKVIEVLNEYTQNRKGQYGDAKQRYYSGDFRITHKSKSISASHKESVLNESMDSIAGFTYF